MSVVRRSFRRLSSKRPASETLSIVNCPLSIVHCLNGLGEADVLARGADLDVELAGLDGPLHVAVEQLQVVGRQAEGDATRLSGLEADALESAQLRLVGRDAADAVGDVELHDLVAGTPSQSL